MANPQINRNDPHLWQHLGIIIDEFEKAAMSSETRDGFLVVAHGPLEAFDQILEAADKALSAPHWGKTKRTEGATGDDDAISGSAGGSVSTEVDGGTPSANVGFDINADADFAAAFPDGSVGDKVSQAISQCTGCEMRLQFQWQLQPIDLLGQFKDLLDPISKSLDGFEMQMNPFKNLEDLCGMGNEFKFFCTPDLIMMLMSLKLLLRKYLAFAFEIKLDWSVILGPLLKLITGLIASLVTSIVGVMAAPIDCAVSVVESIAKVQAELNGLAAAASSAAGDVSAQVDSVGTTGGAKELTRGTTSKSEASFDSSTGRYSGSSSSMKLPAGPSRQSPAKKVDTGVKVSGRSKLPQAVNDKKFMDSHWSEKVLTSLADAREWVTGLDKKLQQAMGNLNALVGGGLSLQLGNIGLLLFIKDMIGLITTIIALIESLGSSAGGAKNIDFCEVVQRRPELLRSHIERMGGRAALGLTFVPEGTDASRLALYNGPDLVGAIPTCVNKRVGTPQGELLAKWIAELNGQK